MWLSDRPDARRVFNTVKLRFIKPNEPFFRLSIRILASKANWKIGQQIVIVQQTCLENHVTAKAGVGGGRLRRVQRTPL